MKKMIRLSVLVSLALPLNGCAAILAGLSNANQGGSQASTTDATASGNAPFDPATTCEQLTTAWSNQRQGSSIEAWNQAKVVYVRRALECNNSEAVFAGMRAFR